MSDRFWSKASGGDYTECWIWAAAIEKGYGLFWNDGRMVRAHRFAYEDMVGEIPVGLQLDHLCRNRACVNPWHLEPVTHRVNSIRAPGPAARASATHCLRGHLYDDANTYIKPSNGTRMCRACRPIREGRAA